MEDSYPVIYIIYSNWSIEKITQFLDNIQSNGIGLLKILYDSNGNETNRTIAVIKEELYNQLVTMGYNTFSYSVDFKIKKYSLGSYLLPPADKSNNLFIPTIKQVTETYVTGIIDDKLKTLANVGIIEPNTWVIKCPKISRDTGIVKQGCFIFFKNVPIHNIATVRFLINNTFWNENEEKKYDNMIKCHWAKYKIYNTY